MSTENADTLRRAAELMRKRATKATTGEEPLIGDHWHYDLTYRSRNNYEVIATNEGSFIAEQVHGRWAAEHIASWHPAVALAVADWLHTAGADLWAHGPLHCADGCMECDDDLWAPHVRRALAVARAYLGEDR